MDKRLEKKLMKKYLFVRSQQNPRELEDNMEIMAKQISKDKIKGLEYIEESFGKKGLISNKIKTYANKNNPKIYGKEIKPIWDLMVFGFECDNGWYKLLDKTFNAIHIHLNKYPDLEFKLAQVKEKYGILMIYYYGGDDYINNIVTKARKESKHICEVCGARGKLCANRIDIIRKEDGFYIKSNGGWLKVLCRKDAEKLGYVYGLTKITDKEAYKYLKNMKIDYEKTLTESERFNTGYINEIHDKLKRINKLLNNITITKD